MARESIEASLDAAPLAVAGGGPDDEATLWQRCRGADDAARALLVERYMPYATALAAKLYGMRGRNDVEFDEYRQFAMIGLLESVDRYQPDRGAQFKTFAMPRIRGAILNGLQHLSERHQQNALRRRVALERAVSLKPEALTVSPTERLLHDLQDIGVGVALGFLLEGTGMLVDPEQGLPDDAYAQLEMRQIHRHLWEMVKHLTDRERDIVHMHYAQGRRFEEIATVLGLSKGRISQVHRQAVSRLRVLITKVARCDVSY
jgi:RNA polymerase sigma factor for flagellar operon FliA